MKKVPIGIIICFLMSCSKDEEPKTSSGSTNITSSSWKYESGGVDIDKNGSIDLALSTISSIGPCRLDNTATFHTDGTGTTDEGATKCNAADPQTQAFTWSFQNNESILNIGGNGLIGTGGQFRIITLSGTAFSLAKDTTAVLVPGLPASPVSIIVNLQH
jgi:hypothetical protein